MYPISRNVTFMKGSTSHFSSEISSFNTFNVVTNLELVIEIVW